MCEWVETFQGAGVVLGLLVWLDDNAALPRAVQWCVQQAVICSLTLRTQHCKGAGSVALLILRFAHLRICSSACFTNVAAPVRAPQHLANGAPAA